MSAARRDLSMSGEQRWQRAAARVAAPGSVILSAWRAEHGPETRRLAARAQSMSKRGYAGAAIGRTTSDWVALSTSADAELYTSLRAMRNRVRQLCRDNEYAKQALRLIVNNVVGQGIGLQAQVMKRGQKLNEPVNAKIEAAWKRWGKARYCHTAAKLSWAAMQRLLIRGVAESGEILVRVVNRRAAGSPIALQLELIEADQLIDNWSGRAAAGMPAVAAGNQIRMGVEVDEWQRPVAYWVYPRHPGDNMVNGVPPANSYERVPADEIIHLGIFERPGQTRCVPWFHAAMTKMRHMGGYEEAEIVRARASASIMGFIQSPEVDGVAGIGEDPMGSDAVVDGEKVFDMSPGIIKELAPGETFEGFNPSTANSAIEGFMRFMLRSVAAGIGMSYESLSRDYSQSNYSSSRLALLDDRDNWRVLQQWLMESLHQEVFDRWLKVASVSGLDLAMYDKSPEIYEGVRWLPRGWDWVDPLKEVTAARMAVRAGFSSIQDVIAAKGGDVEEVLAQIARERGIAADLKLVLETDPAQTNDKGGVQAPAILTDVGIDGAGAGAAAGAAGGGSDDDSSAGQDDDSGAAGGNDDGSGKSDS